jgi:hypothetical protein
VEVKARHRGSKVPSDWALDYDIGLLQISATFPLGAGQP